MRWRAEPRELRGTISFLTIHHGISKLIPSVAQREIDRSF